MGEFCCELIQLFFFSVAVSKKIAYLVNSAYETLFYQNFENRQLVCSYQNETLKFRTAFLRSTVYCSHEKI